MKKALFILAFTLLTFATHAQVFAPNLVGFSGYATIFYPYGHYQGNVYNGVANGLGIFYFRDGTFFRGNFSAGFWNGEGILVSPIYGYLTGYWARGTYTGACQNAYSETDVEDLVMNVQDNMPAAQDHAVSPEGYRIKKIDPDTQMGKTVLGRYRGQ